MMINDGLVDEVQHLKKIGFSPKLNALRTVGYKEVFDFLADDISYENMIELIKRNTRRYAKRQLTWFRRNDRINWISLDGQKEESVFRTIFEIFMKGE